jgi:predicted nucleic-acid-binding Zn-ribbon protein
MSEGRVKTCPKCGNVMTQGNLALGSAMQFPRPGLRLLKSGDHFGDKVVPYYCQKCGYIELYNEKTMKT